MEDTNLAKLLETQISLTAWLQKIGSKDAALMNEEDNHKRERIGVLNQVFDLPYDKPVQFEAADVQNNTLEFQLFIKEHGQELCALRLNPKRGTTDLQKLRMRGKTIIEAVKWFQQQTITAKDYLADFVPHPSDYSWATIFVVNRHGIFGEIYFGGHHILTQGFHEGSMPSTFSYNFKDWNLEPAHPGALSYLQRLVEMIKITDKTKQKRLAELIDATFVHDYLEGYFESTDSKDVGTWFIDYNRVLGKQYSDFQTIASTPEKGALVTGKIVSGGIVEGVVKIVSNPQTADFQKGDILVCKMTSPDYLPLMQKAGAIITDQGGILCHAAIVARELNKTCLVGTGNATSVLHTGDQVIVNAKKGTVTLKGK